MTNNNNLDNHSRVSELISKRQLRDAFLLLSRSSIVKKTPMLADLLSKQEENYRLLLHYLAQGFKDKSRHKMLNDIVVSLLFINDSILRSSLAVDSPELYFSTLRFGQVRKTSVADAVYKAHECLSVAELEKEAGINGKGQQQFDEALENLFNSVWTMFGDNSDSYSLLKETLFNSEIAYPIKSQIISALLLGNLKFYDRKAFFLLLDFFESDPEPRLSAHSLVALILILESHKERIASDIELAARLGLWEDNIVIYRQLRETIMQLIKAHDTQRITNKMTQEVLPELMKLKPEIVKKLKSISEIADLEILEENPEWEQLINKNGIGDKLKELTDMQMEGGDVMMMAFSNLKGFPFFSKVANWFLPFSSHHHEVKDGLYNQTDILNKLLDMEGIMCDSDKYSFAFSIEKMPEEQRNLMISKMDEQMNQLREVIEEKRLGSSIPEFDAEVTRYVRDIYRFFKLFSRKNEFNDFFSRPIDFQSLPAVGNILSDTEILNLVGEFYFKRGYYKEALPMLLKLNSKENNDPLLWEKIGYCYGALGNTEKSLEWYRKAELLHPDSNWLIKKIAMTYHLTGQPDRAIEYYKRALESDPENPSLILSCANSLLETGEYKEALTHLYHLNYLNPESLNVWRLIADAETRCSNFEKAMAYYSKLKNVEKSHPKDWFDAGNVHYILGDFPSALSEYKNALSRINDYPDFNLDKEIEDSEILISNSEADLETWKLILDKLKYDL